MADADDRARGYSGGRRPAPRRPTVDTGRLWAGGAATAVIAALIPLLGLLIIRVLLQIPYLAPIEDGAIGDTDEVVELCIMAALAALAATALAHVLLLAVPGPMAYFGWIVGLLTAVVAVWPLAFSGEPLTVRIATGLIYLVIGMAIISLVTSAATSATTTRA